jgi:hypothetical protein
MYPSHFAKRWTPPSTKTVLYYPLYGGYHSSNCPVLFANPMHAMTWAITRFKKDGICNAWAGKTLPDFLHFVGVFKCDQSEVSEIDIPVYCLLLCTIGHRSAIISSLLEMQTGRLHPLYEYTPRCTRLPHVLKFDLQKGTQVPHCITG